MAAPPPKPADDNRAATAARTVPCPRCGQPARFAPDNPYRPFCGARCKARDLGAWASEDFCVPAQPDHPADDGTGGGPPLH